MVVKKNSASDPKIQDVDEYEIVEEGQEGALDRVSENPKRDALEVLRSAVPSASQLTVEDIERKDEIKGLVDFRDTNSLIEFGADVSSEVAGIAETILADTKIRNLSAVGTELNELITALETGNFYGDDKGYLSKMKRWFKKKRNSMISVEDVIGKIEGIVDTHIASLDEYVPMLDALLSANEKRFKELRLYILAGKERIEEMKKEFEDKYNEFLGNDGVIDEFERQKLMEVDTNMKIFVQKIQDLENLSMMAVTNAAQINAMKGSASMIGMKMKNAKVGVIPVYRMQGVINAVSTDLKSIVDASRSMSDTTQRMLKANVDMTGDLTRGAVKEFHRPLVEYKTLEYVLGSIRKTYDDVEKLAQDGQKQLLAGNKEIEKLLGGLSSQSLKQLEGPKKKKK